MFRALLVFIVRVFFVTFFFSKKNNYSLKRPTMIIINDY